MKSSHRRLLILALCLFMTSWSFAEEIYVAVLETKSIVKDDEQIGLSERLYITDKLLVNAHRVLPNRGYTIMTRENINSIVDPNKPLEDCEGECTTETGRNIGAHYVAQARLGKFGEKYTLTVELYDTKGGSLLSCFTAMTYSLEELLEEVDEKSTPFFGSILSASGYVSPAASEGPYEEDSGEPETAEPAKPEVPQEAIPEPAIASSSSGIHWIPLLISTLFIAGGTTIAVLENNEARSLSEKDDPSSEKEYRKRLDDIKTAQSYRALGLGIAIAGGLGAIISIAF